MVAIALLAGRGESSAAGCPTGAAFGRSVELTTQIGSFACTSADLNHDGLADAIFGGPSGSVTIKLGNSNDTGAESSFNIAGPSFGLAVADVNADGILDIISVGDSGLSYILGNGQNHIWDGTFAAPVTIPTVSNPRRICVADLDGDAYPDLVIGSYGGRIAVYHGSSSGSFVSVQTIITNDNPFSVRTGDFNGDGRTDIAAAALEGHVDILLNDGSASAPHFSLAHVYAAVGELLDLVVGDFNLDGALDLAATDNPGLITVFLGHLSGGHGDGSFAEHRSFQVGGSTPYGLTSADVDGDGIIDLISGNNSSDISLLRGTGDGTFHQQETYPSGGSGTTLAVGDIDGNGTVDVIASGDRLVLGLCASLGPYAPTILSFQPAGGAVGDQLTIAGAFLANPTAVTLGDVPCMVVSATASRIVTAVPAGATTGPIHVSTAVGGATSATSFVVGSHPTIDLFAPASARPGQVVTVHGSNFEDVTACSFGGQSQATYTVVNPNEITLTVDALSQSGPIHVWTITGEAVSASSFTALPPDSAAHLLSVRDVAHDQGGRVVVKWLRSDFDTPQSRLITSYRVWRRAAPNTTFMTGRSSASARRSQDVWFWEPVGEVPAAQLDGYAFTAQTLQDSLSGSTGWTAFFVQALTSSSSRFYASNIDSGYSVDNLSPPAPSPFVASYSGGATHLHWPPSPAADFHEFRLYRGATRDFVPGSANLLVASRDTAFTDFAVASYTYKLVSLDIHGNASGTLAVTPDHPVGTLATLIDASGTKDHVDLLWYAADTHGSTATVYRRTTTTDWQRVADVQWDGNGYLRFQDTDVEPGSTYGYRLGMLDAGVETMVAEAWVTAATPLLALQGAMPNPARASNLSIALTLPDDSGGDLELLDVNGRRVASTRLAGLGRGPHIIPLLGSSRLNPGIYLVRLRQGGLSRTKRVVLLN